MKTFTEDGYRIEITATDRGGEQGRVYDASGNEVWSCGSIGPVESLVRENFLRVRRLEREQAAAPRVKGGFKPGDIVTDKRFPLSPENLFKVQYLDPATGRLHFGRLNDDCGHGLRYDASSFRHATEKEQQTHKGLVRARFGFDDGPTFKGFTNGATWNGWACPMLGEREFRRFLKWFVTGGLSIASETDSEVVLLSEGEEFCTFGLRSTPPGTPTKEANLWDVSAGLCWYREDEVSP